MDLRRCPLDHRLVDGDCVPQTAPEARHAPGVCPHGDFGTCQERCLAGDAPSCGRLGLMALQSERARTRGGPSPAPADWTRAAARLSGALAKACLEAEEANACVAASLALKAERYGPHQARGEEAPQPLLVETETRAATLYEAGCRAGEGEACNRLAHLMADGIVDDLDAARLLDTVRQGCSRSPVACVIHGNLLTRSNGGISWVQLMNSGLPEDGAAARWSYGRACDGGVVDGCFFLGIMHLPPADLERRLEALGPAAMDLSESAPFQSQLGAPGGHDATRAAALLKRACALGAQAQVTLDFDLVCPFAE